jgi:hypothetical protein
MTLWWAPCPHCGWPLPLRRDHEGIIRQCSRPTCEGFVKQLNGKFVLPEEYPKEGAAP